MKNVKNAFTMVEMLIATSILSLLILTSYSLFTYASKSFDIGTWRLTTQKKTQTFLLRFKETLEKANHAYSIAPNGNKNRVGGARYVLIDTSYYNKLASSSNKLILCGSITSPSFTVADDLGGGNIGGIWKGFSLQCFNRTLKFYQTGNWDSMDPSPPPVIGTADPTRFALNNTTGDFFIELENVDSIGIEVQNATGSTSVYSEMLVSLSVTVVNPKSKGVAKVTERITAKLLDRKKEEIISQALGITLR